MKMCVNATGKCYSTELASRVWLPLWGTYTRRLSSLTIPHRLRLSTNHTAVFTR